ncbi:MAG: right-handed parallel beta-helix repeat-containing protein, partial [Bacteroidales bacterium]|nr:right-handed parallel beta-helix repeat-containing protein [Bacteroidales bacterium]
APQQQMRCGVLVTTSESGRYSDIKLADLLVRDVFFEEPGFERGEDEVKTANGRQSYGWGIRFINSIPDAQLNNLTVENCHISNVAHTGLKFTGKDKSIHHIKVLNNRVQETGGPGIQMSGVHQGHVKGNQVHSSGSNNDSRKWGRGSGLWTWGTSNVVIEHNTFKNANGPGDSAGCHIDYNCNNVIVQYNLSVNNAGGFCEILGNNYNCAYRYNISVNDGYRVKGEDGAFQEGKIFWLSGYQGNKKRSGPFNSYFYNNTIYVNKGIVAKIAIDKASAGVLIANNIFYIEGESELVKGDQYNPEKAGVSTIRDIVFKNNLYLKQENWPADVLIQDEQPLIGNPEFTNPGESQLNDYIPLNVNLVKDKGISISPVPNDSIGLYIGLELSVDILGNRIKNLPDLGAIEVN